MSNKLLIQWSSGRTPLGVTIFCCCKSRWCQHCLYWQLCTKCEEFECVFWLLVMLLLLLLEFIWFVYLDEWSIKLHCSPRKLSLGQGNAFTPVSHSVHGEGVLWYHVLVMDNPPPEQHHSPSHGQHHHPRHQPPTFPVNKPAVRILLECFVVADKFWPIYRSSQKEQFKWGKMNWRKKFIWTFTNLFKFPQKYHIQYPYHNASKMVNIYYFVHSKFKIIIFITQIAIGLQ